MKRLLLLFTLGLMLNGLSFQAQAQGYFNQAQEGQIKWGVRGGANYFNLGKLDLSSIPDLDFAGISIETEMKTSHKIGFQIGGYADIWMSPSFSFMPEINFIKKGAKITQTIKLDLAELTADIGFPIEGTMEIDADFNSDFYYVEAPMLLGFRPIPSLTLFAGPQASYLVYQKFKSTTEEDPENPDESTEDEIIGTEGLKKFLIGAAAGVQFDITPKINIGARYALDLSSAAKEDQNQKKFKNSGFALSIGYSF